jgi:hypothetical protein
MKSKEQVMQHQLVTILGVQTAIEMEMNQQYNCTVKQGVNISPCHIIT